MAYEDNACGIPGIVAGADLTGSQFLFCVINSSGKAVVNTTAGGICDGVLQNKPDTDEGATVKPRGVSKVKAGGAVAAGSLVASSAAGKAAVATAGQEVQGRALEAATADGDLIAVSLDTSGQAT